MLSDTTRAGGVAALVSGAPSTLWAFANGTDPLAPSLAAGAMVCPVTASRAGRLIAAGAVHTLLSLAWAHVLAAAPARPQRCTAGALWGAAGGVVIAILNLGVAHASNSARLGEVRALCVLPQLADHLAYGAVVGAMLTRQDSTYAQRRRATRKAWHSGPQHS